MAALVILALPALRASADPLDAGLGHALFERQWVPAPASTATTDGLGPLFNARSCAACHPGGGGGALAVDAEGWLRDRGAVVRLADSQGNADPVYGHQIETQAVQGLQPEARVRIAWRETPGRLGDGTVLALRRPLIELAELKHGPLAPGTERALRLAPDLRVAAVTARVDPVAAGLGQDARLFGRKATQGSLDRQISLAFARDLGLSTTAFPDATGDCTTNEPECRAAPQGAYGADTEIAPVIVAALARFLEGLDVPQTPVPKTADPGRDLFKVVGCAACHTPELPGRDGGRVSIYSDLRPHDLGPDLADPMPTDGRAGGIWRTQPLTGLGLSLAAGRPLLHDGRARSVPEAILWHAGEAAPAREAYRMLDAASRLALENFLSRL